MSLERLFQRDTPSAIKSDFPMSQEAYYPSSAEFVAKAHVSGMDAYRALYRRAAEPLHGR